MAAPLLLLGALSSAVAPAACLVFSPPPPPLQVTIFFESLCPDCQDFISSGFAGAWRAVPEILNVTLVPWGFAKATPNGAGGWTFKCQHGPNECQGNKLHACGIRQAGASQHRVAVDFSICLETDRLDAADCARTVGLDWNTMIRCLDDPATDGIMLQYRDMTEDAQPPVDEVPTVSVDGSRLHEEQMLDDFLGYVCAVWKGPKPPGCPASEGLEA